VHRACLIDALGTTVRLLPPWERIDPGVVAGIDPAVVRRGFEAEMSFYAAHAHEARDEATLAGLRASCAELLSAEIGRAVDVETMMSAIVFEAFPDAAPALAGLRELGLRTVCVSNWDHDLGRVLERVGLARWLDDVVVSALAGARKPDPEIFRLALERAGCSAEDAIHVGDSGDDVAGASAAGIEVLRIDRSGGGDIASLAEIVEHLRR
jgi:HAD superfamily hydrolase (TIGR01493 family)